VRWDTGTVLSCACLILWAGSVRSTVQILAEERGRQSDDGDDVHVRFIRVSRCEARQYYNKICILSVLVVLGKGR